MLEAVFTAKFKKELKKAQKRGLNMKKLNKVIDLLVDGKKLPRRYHDHALTNSRDYHNVRECHIEPDWLLIYRIEGDTLTLYLMRTGTHSDLFGK